MARGLAALGARVEVTDDGLDIEGGPLHAGEVGVAQDHRLAFAFGVLARHLPGLRLRGLAAASKSDPWFVADVLGGGPAEG